MVPNSLLSVPHCSTWCQYDIMKVLLKKIDQNLAVGYVKVLFEDFWLEKLLNFSGFYECVSLVLTLIPYFKYLSISTQLL
jgi:hypothetical protein